MMWLNSCGPLKYKPLLMQEKFPPEMQIELKKILRKAEVLGSWGAKSGGATTYEFC